MKSFTSFGSRWQCFGVWPQRLLQGLPMQSLTPFHSCSFCIESGRRSDIPRNKRCLETLATSSSSSSSSGSSKEFGRFPACLDNPPVTAGEMIDVNPPRGTRDFAPEEMRLRSWLFHNFREVSRLFAFEEVDFPVLESEALYVRKAGEEITQQLYSFEDKGGRRMALRPEITPSLARLIIKKGKAVPFPVKWFTIGQCWRYERMTRGRRREHYQWNMDVIGISGIEVLQGILDRYVIPQESFAAVCVIMDKMHKMGKEEIKDELANIKVPKEAAEGILNALSIQSLKDLEGLLGSDYEAIVELRDLFHLAEGYGFAHWLKFNASIVRGLAYYTGIVFEGFDKEGKFRAICGGGRYDQLLSTFGAAYTPACGFGFGDAVIMELLKDKGLLPSLQPEVDDVVVPLEERLRFEAVMIASKLRRSGRAVELVLETKRLKWAFKHAERFQAKRMVIIGSTEWEQNKVRVKDLASREEKDVSVNELLAENINDQDH